MGKKEGILFLGLFLLVSSLFFVNAVTCDIVPRSACLISQGNNIIMGLSSETNAHAEKISVDNSNNYVCLGEATACSTYDDNQNACLAQAGCEFFASASDTGGIDLFLPLTGYPIVEGTCSGTPDACSTYDGVSADDQINCENQAGCTYGITYDYALCCDTNNPVGKNECSGGYKILKLSSLTNAHVEAPHLSAYTTEVCSQHIGADCMVEEPNMNPFPEDFEPILSLSHFTNAHVSVPTDTNLPFRLFCNVDYGIIIPGTWCGDEIIQNTDLTGGPNDQGIEEQCETGGANCDYGTCQCVEGYEYRAGLGCLPAEAEIGDIRWVNPADPNDPINGGPDWDGRIESSTQNPISVQVGENVFWLILKNSGYTSSGDAVFTVYDKDWWFFGDEEIKTIVGSKINFAGDVGAYWIVTQTDLEATEDADLIDFSGANDGFYFTVEHATEGLQTSEDLKVVIVETVPCEPVTMCMDYMTQDRCENDDFHCNVAAYSVSLNNPETDCEDPTIECSCAWDVLDNPPPPEGCGPFWSAIDINGNKIGSCNYDEQTGDTCDDDNFLTYSWTSDWVWDPDDNGGFTQQDCDADFGQGNCVEDPVGSGIYYNDPNNANAKCQSGQNTVPCPARIQLTFFNKYNLAGAIIIIVLIYLILNYQKRKRPRRKVRKKKK